MFTGLVAATGSVQGVDRTDEGARLEIAAGVAAELEPGASVAVSGVCLTTAELSEGGFRVDVMEETLRRSSLGRLSRGDRVNLELPLRAGDRLGGHIVQGHVDGVGTVESAAADGFARRLAIRAGPDVCRYVVGRGSVAIDGVSLTALDPVPEAFAVALIPETLERTTLGALEPGDSVNIEVDVVAKYVERLLPGTGTSPAVPTAAGAVR